ncbi:MAG: hypothetical protein IBX71_01460 [Candidatus Desulforudis sp.]|nr:hypothetical protein [Desulforudis sp.]
MPEKEGTGPRERRPWEVLDTKWWIVLLVSTILIAFLIGVWTGPRFGPSPQARPAPGEEALTQAELTAYLTDPANRDRAADILSSPQMREPFIDIMGTVRMQGAFAHMLQDPRMQENVIDIMSDPTTINATERMFTLPRMQTATANILGRREVRAGVLEMISQRQMQGLLQDMARDPRLRPILAPEAEPPGAPPVVPAPGPGDVED